MKEAIFLTNSSPQNRRPVTTVSCFAEPNVNNLKYSNIFWNALKLQYVYVRVDYIDTGYT